MKANALLAISADASRRGDYEQSLAVGREALTLIDDLGLDELARACAQHHRLGSSPDGRRRGIRRLRAKHRDRERARITEGDARACEHRAPPQAPRPTFCAHSSTSKRPCVSPSASAMCPIGGSCAGSSLTTAIGTAAGTRRWRPPTRTWKRSASRTTSFGTRSGHAAYSPLAWGRQWHRGLRSQHRGRSTVGRPDDASGHARGSRPLVDPRRPARRGRAAMEEALAIMETGIVKAGFDLPHLVFRAVELGGRPAARAGGGQTEQMAEAARHYFAGDFGRAADVYGETGSRTDEAEARSGRVAHCSPPGGVRRARRRWEERSPSTTRSARRTTSDEEKRCWPQPD